MAEQETSSSYTPTWFQGLANATRESAQIIVPMVYDMVKPASVLDVGCGVGTWLAEWSKAGADIQGIDGTYVKTDALEIPVDKFKPWDLEKPFSLGRKFDLVQSLEVAEHLDEASADKFVESLTSHGETILFSAAVPGQGGEHHVNERWPSYWAEKFEKAGYTPFDPIRPQIWNDRRVNIWYKQNIVLYARGRSFGSPATALDLVHPQMWEDARLRLRLAPAAIKTLLTRKGRASQITYK